MSEFTRIEWVMHTWNPWEGCTKVSPGCVHCYAEARNHRFGMDNWGKGKPRRRTSEANWWKPLKWNERSVVCSECDFGVGHAGNIGAICPRLECGGSMIRQSVFPSLCDWLDDEVPIQWLADFLRLIKHTPNLDWLLLTKRPENFLSRLIQASGSLQHLASNVPLSEMLVAWAAGHPPKNVWIGVSIEDQQRANERIPDLLRIPAKVRFLSCEPLLGPIDFSTAAPCGYYCDHDADGGGHLPGHGLSGIHWIILGGESGHGARLCKVEWLYDIQKQAMAGGVPCFNKQLGAKPYTENANTLDWPDATCFDGCGEGFAAGYVRLKDRKGGNPEEWPEELRVREFPC